MAEVNAAAPAVQPIVLGNKLLTPGADGKTVQISNKDGSDAQSMDVAAFKKYLQEHKEEILAASQKQQGDTVNFKGRESEEGKPEKKGLSTGTILLGTAAVVGLGIWKKDLVVKYWNKVFKPAAKEIEEKSKLSLKTDEKGVSTDGHLIRNNPSAKKFIENLKANKDNLKVLA